MTRPIPDCAVRLVALHEGLRLKAYPDPATGGDPWTIGFGHTGLDVHPGKVISKAEALDLLRSDMRIAVRKLYAVLKPAVIDGLTDEQYGALLSFAFNVGAKASWTIWRHINAGKLDLVPAELMRFTRANGKVMKGLVNRRAAEAKLWSESSPDEEAPPSSVTRQVGVTPPVTDAKPVGQSKTFWTGAGVAASGLVTAGQQIQSLAAPQAANSDLIAKLAAAAAVLIVAGGIAVMVFRWLDAKKARQ